MAPEWYTKKSLITRALVPTKPATNAVGIGYWKENKIHYEIFARRASLYHRFNIPDNDVYASVQTVQDS